MWPLAYPCDRPFLRDMDPQRVQWTGELIAAFGNFLAERLLLGLLVPGLRAGQLGSVALDDLKVEKSSRRNSNGE